MDPIQVIFHPVWVDSRVQYPSHFKRFEAQMFAFAKDNNNLKEHVSPLSRARTFPCLDRFSIVLQLPEKVTYKTCLSCRSLSTAMS